MEDRKLKEIEHSKIRREILKGFERETDTSLSNVDLGDVVKTTKQDFDKYFSNMKYYSIVRLSENFKRKFIDEHATKDVRFLDFACGNGENGLYAASKGASVIGIDISPEGIVNANENAKSMSLSNLCTFQVMDGESMSFESEYFDYAVEYGALHHVDLHRALEELARVLKSNGEMVCVEALRHNPLIHLYRKLTPHLRTAWEVDHILGIESLDVMRNYFNEVEVKYFHFFSLLAVPFRKNKKIFSILLSTLEYLDNIILNIPFIKRYAWIMVIKLGKPKKL